LQARDFRVFFLYIYFLFLFLFSFPSRLVMIYRVGSDRQSGFIFTGSLRYVSRLTLLITTYTLGAANTSSVFLYLQKSTTTKVPTYLPTYLLTYVQIGKLHPMGSSPKVASSPYPKKKNAPRQCVYLSISLCRRLSNNPRTKSATGAKHRAVVSRDRGVCRYLLALHVLRSKCMYVIGDGKRL
jgi:hypothetical protein